MIAILVSIFGGLGAACRFVSDGLLRTILGRQFPWATMLINISGSFVLGFITGLVLHGHGFMNMKLIFGTGFCGGYTTFSSASFESVRLIEEKRYSAFWLQMLGNLTLSILAAYYG